MTKPLGAAKLFVLLFIGLFCGQTVYAAPEPVPEVISAPVVAVFPLRNATGEAELDWVSIGLQDSLLAALDAHLAQLGQADERLAYASGDRPTQIEIQETFYE